jgi:hypothetical protein
VAILAEELKMMDVNLISQTGASLAQPWWYYGLILLLTIIGAIASVFLFMDYSPKLHLRIIPIWINENLVKIRLEMENYSKVLIILDSKRFKVDILKEFNSGVTEWVDFSGANDVFLKTEKLYPGEIISIELLKFCAIDSYLHVGLQVKTDIGLVDRARNITKETKESWTTTRFIIHKNNKIVVNL